MGRRLLHCILGHRGTTAALEFAPARAEVIEREQDFSHPLNATGVFDFSSFEGLRRVAIGIIV